MISEPEIKVIVATHKKCEVPPYEVYCPILVGAALRDETEREVCKDYVFDDLGDNISSLNGSFCELTGLYYAWKNFDADYIGLVHYRRLFANRFIANGTVDKAIAGEKLAELLKKYKIIVPKKQKYYIETMYSHYAHTHYAIHLDKTRDIIKQLHPEYLNAYDRVMKQRRAYMFNMMILPKDMLNEYCEWLFSVLFRLQEELSMPELSSFHGRYYGRVAEIIFNVWLQYQVDEGLIDKSSIKELPILYVGKIEWGKKVLAFLKAKFFHKKYGGSF